MRRFLAFVVFAALAVTVGAYPFTGRNIGRLGAINSSTEVIFNYLSGFDTEVQSQFSGTTDAESPTFSGTAMQVIDGTVGQHEAGAVWYNVAKVSVASFTTDFTFQRNYGAITGESVGTGDGSTETFSYTASHGVVPGTYTITAGSVSGTDNGSGTISGTGISGTINYVSGAVSVTFTSAPSDGQAIDAAYSSPPYGLALVIQNDPLGLSASADANGLGYMTYTYNNPDNAIHDSVALVFNATPNSVTSGYVVGSAPSMVGLYTNGGPYVNDGIFPVQDLSRQGISLFNEDVMSAHVVYDGTALSLDLTDTNTGAVAHFDWPINIASVVGADTAYIGFGGGTIPPGQELVQGWRWEQGTTGRLSGVAFNPAPGAYTSSQSVTLSGPSGATIYYTTNGQPPTITSNVYSAPLAVSSNEAIQAIAVESGYENSLPTLGNYQIQSTSSPTINFASGFSEAAGLLQLAGISSISGADLLVTDGIYEGEIGSAFYIAPINIQTFSTTFTLEWGSNSHNGVVFVIKNTALSPFVGVGFSLTSAPASGATSATLSSAWGGATNTNDVVFSDGETRLASFTNGSASITWTAGLTNTVGENINVGRSSDTAISGAPYTLGAGSGSANDPSYAYQSIGSSVGVFFDVWNGAVGLATGGGFPIETAITGITLNSGDPISCTLTYNGTSLALSMEDTVTQGTFSTNWTVNISSEVGADTAYVGFTGGSYDSLASQAVTSWTM